MEPQDLTLKQILDDPIMLLAFRDFTKTALADENLDFYLAVKEYEALFRKPGMGKPGLSSNRLFGSMLNVKRDDASAEEPTSMLVSSPGDGGKRVLGMSKIFGSMVSMTSKAKAESPQPAPRKESAPMEADKTTDVKILGMAMRIYKEYLIDKSKRWVCIEPVISDVILARIETGTVELNLFDSALKKTFDNMEKDLVPRFNKSFNFVYTSGERIENSNRGSVRFSPRSEHKRHFDTIVAKAAAVNSPSSSSSAAAVQPTYMQQPAAASDVVPVPLVDSSHAALVKTPAAPPQSEVATSITERVPLSSETPVGKEGDEAATRSIKVGESNDDDVTRSAAEAQE